MADAFAKIGDIQGESTDAAHRGEIDVTSWSWGVSQTGTIAAGGGGGAGRPSFQDFQFTHGIDKASPSLLKACATGQHLPEATVTVRKAGGSQQDFLVIKMNDVVVTSVHPAGPGGGVLTEAVSMQFAKVDLEYKPQKPDGSLDAGVHFKYDIRNNREG